jgi:hypothetical protein
VVLNFNTFLPKYGNPTPYLLRIQAKLILKDNFAMKEEEFFLAVLDQERDEEEIGYHKDCLMWLAEASNYYEVYDVGFYDVVFKKKGSYKSFRKNLLQAITEYGFDPFRVFTIHSKNGSANPYDSLNPKTGLSSFSSNSSTPTESRTSSTG